MTESSKTGEAATSAKKLADGLINVEKREKALAAKEAEIEKRAKSLDDKADDLGKRENALAAKQAAALKIVDAAKSNAPVSGNTILVISTQPKNGGHYRAGMFHPNAGHRLKLSDLDEDQIKLIDDDNNLVVTPVADDVDDGETTEE